MAVKQNFEALYFKAAFCLTSENMSDFTPVSRTLGVEVNNGMGTVFTALGARYEMPYVAREGFLATDSCEADTRSVDKVPVGEIMRYVRGQVIRENAVPEEYKEFVETVKAGKEVYKDYQVCSLGEKKADVLFLISPADKTPLETAQNFAKLAGKAGKSVYATNEYGDCGYLMIQLELVKELEARTEALKAALDAYDEIVTDDQFILDALLMQFEDKADKICFVDEFIFEHKDALAVSAEGRKIAVHESGIINRLYPLRKVDYAQILTGAELVYPARNGYDVSDTGIAGGLGFAEEEALKTVAKRRVRDLEALEADEVITPCGAEKAGLEIGGAKKADSLLSYMAAL